MTTMTTANTIAGHFLASAEASRKYARFGSPADLHAALDHFNTAKDTLNTLHDINPHTLTALQSLRTAAARGDYATAQAHYATIAA